MLLSQEMVLRQEEPGPGLPGRGGSLLSVGEGQRLSLLPLYCQEPSCRHPAAEGFLGLDNGDSPAAPEAALVRSPTRQNSPVAPNPHSSVHGPLGAKVTLLCAVNSVLLRLSFSPRSPRFVHLLERSLPEQPSPRCGAPRVPKRTRLDVPHRWSDACAGDLPRPELLLTHQHPTQVGVCGQRAHGTRLRRVSSCQHASSPEALLLRAHSASPERTYRQEPAAPGPRACRQLRVRRGEGSGSRGWFLCGGPGHGPAARAVPVTVFPPCSSRRHRVGVKRCACGFTLRSRPPAAVPLPRAWGPLHLPGGAPCPVAFCLHTPGH